MRADRGRAARRAYGVDCLFGPPIAISWPAGGRPVAPQPELDKRLTEHVGRSDGAYSSVKTVTTGLSGAGGNRARRTTTGRWRHLARRVHPSRPTAALGEPPRPARQAGGRGALGGRGTVADHCRAADPAVVLRSFDQHPADMVAISRPRGRARPSARGAVGVFGVRLRLVPRPAAGRSAAAARSTIAWAERDADRPPRPGTAGPRRPCAGAGWPGGGGGRSARVRGRLADGRPPRRAQARSRAGARRHHAVPRPTDTSRLHWPTDRWSSARDRWHLAGQFTAAAVPQCSGRPRPGRRGRSWTRPVAGPATTRRRATASDTGGRRSTWRCAQATAPRAPVLGRSVGGVLRRPRRPWPATSRVGARRPQGRRRLPPQWVPPDLVPGDRAGLGAGRLASYLLTTADRLGSRRPHPRRGRSLVQCGRVAAGC